MSLHRTTISTAILFAILGGGAGCSDSSGPGTTTPNAFTGTVVDATDPLIVLAGIKVVVLDDATGLPLSPAIEGTSASDGKVTLDIPAGTTFGIKAFGGAGHTDTYSFHFTHETIDKLIRMGSEAATSLVPAIAGYTADEERSAVAGAVYWKTPEMAQYGFIGCATIEGEGVADVRYFAASLPSANSPPPDGWPVARGTNPDNGRFFVGNMTPGMRTLTIKLRDAAGTVLGTTSLPVFPRKDSSTKVNGAGANLFLASLNIDAPSGSTNPTPASCVPPNYGL
jgi:hypothetical protein